LAPLLDRSTSDRCFRLKLVKTRKIRVLPVGTSALKDYSGFQKATITMNENVSTVDMNGIVNSILVNIHNDMDFLQFEIMCFSSTNHHHNKTIDAMNTPLRRSPCLLAWNINHHNQQPPSESSLSSVKNNLSEQHDITNTDTTSLSFQSLSKNQHLRTTTSKPSSVFPKNVMSIIASFYVQLHQITSPREQAIRTMNSLLQILF
jgi:hypothetical protein